MQPPVLGNYVHRFKRPLEVTAIHLSEPPSLETDNSAFDACADKSVFVRLIRIFLCPV